MRDFWPYITPAKCFFLYLPNWTSTDLWCVVLYVTYSTTHQRSVEVQFGRYQKNILHEWYMVKNLSCVSHGSLKRFPHTFTIETQDIMNYRTGTNITQTIKLWPCGMGCLVLNLSLDFLLISKFTNRLRLHQFFGTKTTEANKSLKTDANGAYL